MSTLRIFFISQLKIVIHYISKKYLTIDASVVSLLSSKISKRFCFAKFSKIDLDDKLFKIYPFYRNYEYFR